MKLSFNVPLQTYAWQFIRAFIEAWWAGEDHIKVVIENAEIEVKPDSAGEKP